LLHIGISDIDIFAEASVRISKRWDHATHQDASWTNPFRLWRGAFELAGAAYTSKTDLFLVVRPGCYLWEQLPVYCESTIDRNVIGVWSPLTPNRIFPTQAVPRPTCRRKNRDQPEMNWCPMQVNADVSVHQCLVMTGHMLALAAAYLPPVKPATNSDEMRLDGMHIGSVLAYSLGMRRVPYYFSYPSLAQVDDVNYMTSEFIGVNTHVPQKDMRRFDYIREFAKT